MTLGTIKRYGVVADAIIMLGGLIGELKAGGYVIGNNNTGGIVDSENDDDESGSLAVNADEARRYLKLFKESLSDICRIANTLLK